MGDFEYYIKQGFQHILDIEGYDHILFVVMLCAAYELKHWRKIVVLVSAFTIGHSITLGLAVFKLVSISSSLVELFIALTILFTCLFNIFFSKRINSNKVSYNYLLALVFGLIHGLGFSNYLSAIMMGIDNITIPLLSFNLGIELGQLQIVLQFIGLVYILTELGLSFRLRKNIISGVGILIVVPMIIERL